ncbi:MAG: nucleotidyltransferase domain-containing protein [Rhodocyclaceae bacterium]|nr:nucleotidyltransferase domain-containing protein [Rhodocyclaceae bacterium]
MTTDLQRAIDCLATALPVGSKVILFGSAAENRARADSDLDLFVIEPEVANLSEEAARLAALLGRQLIAADVVVQDAATFDKQRRIPNTLAWHVARRGIAYGIEH